MSTEVVSLRKPEGRSKLLNTRVLFDFLLYIILMIFALNYIKNNLHASVDDSFITFRYAQNLMQGNGLVFNPGERFYGSTAMGFALILAAITFTIQHVQRLISIENVIGIHKVAVALSGVSLWMMGVVWYRTYTYHRFSWFRWLAGLAVGLYFIFSLYSTLVPGHETYTFFAFLTLSVYLFVFAQKYLVSSLILFLSFTVRPDGLLFAGIIFLAGILSQLFHSTRKTSELKSILQSVGLFTIFTLGWECFLRFYFGSWLPKTMVAKKAQVALGHWKIFNLKNIVEAIESTAFPGFLFLLSFAIGVFVTYLLLHKSDRDKEKENFSLIAVLWLLFGVGLFLAYSSFQVTLWRWYEIPIYFALMSGLLAILFLFATHLESIMLSGNSKYKLSILLFIVLILTLISGKVYEYAKLRWTTINENQHIVSYDAVVKYFHRKEPNGVSVATAEPGALGYNLGEKYKIIDYLGLISPGVAEAIIAGDRTYYFQKWKPDYIIVSWEGRYTPLGDRWFEENYQLVKEFDHPYWRRNLNRGVYLFKLVEKDTSERD